jgi:predicted phosphodiesterase
MRLAALADIHGNADALAAVLADLAGQGADAVLVLGDHFSGPLAAAETWEVLRGLDALSLRGNHDRHLIELPRGAMGLSDGAAHDDLPRAALDWLAGLPPVLQLEGVFACHGTPARDDVYLCERVTPRGEVEGRAPSEVAQSLEGIAAGLTLCAHSHLPRDLRLPDGRQVVNPGSVGCPAYTDDTPVPHVVSCGFVQASYAVLTRGAGGWAVDLRRVAYDSARMVARARGAARDDWAEGLASGRIGP